MEDPAIIELYWRREEAAIAASQEKYGPLCYSVAYHILTSSEDAEECVNDTWHRAWETIPPQRPGSLRAYLCRITRNLSLSQWRARHAQKRGGGLELLLGELEDCVPAACSAEEAAESREIAAIIEEWLDALPKADRVIFLRRYWFGATIGELAELAGCRPSQMTQRLFRLRTSLRKVLERKGVAL